MEPPPSSKAGQPGHPPFAVICNFAGNIHNPPCGFWNEATFESPLHFNVARACFLGPDELLPDLITHEQRKMISRGQLTDNLRALSQIPPNLA